jgi:DNA-binding SARP family transcriptional activator
MPGVCTAVGYCWGPFTRESARESAMTGLQVSLFGRFAANWNGGTLSGLASTKVQALFSYLLLHRDRPHFREGLAELLWGDSPTIQSRKYLRQALWLLQSSLSASLEQSHDLLIVEPEWVRLNSGAGIWLDVAELERAAALANGVPAEGLSRQSAKVIQASVDLYRGHLLESCYADWCLFERERLLSIYLDLLDKLMGYCELNGQYEPGMAYGERVLRCDRARERAHRRLMRLLYLAGDRSGALRQYERCAAILEEELGVKPARSTVALYDQICGDRLERSEPEPVAEPVRAGSAPSAIVNELQQLQRALREIEHRVQQGIHLVNTALDQPT